MKAIEIINLTKTYTNVKAVGGISFSINEGEFFGFLGPNGAGKTTTINILTGLADYDSGKVTVFGLNVFVFEAIRELFVCITGLRF